MTNWITIDDSLKGRKIAINREQERIINLLLDLNVIRRCAATDKLVAFDTNGENVVYLTGLETNE
jgi:hypothetical protein